MIVSLLAAAGLKVWLATGSRTPFNADEAVVALMARHILQGERPVFFYGQVYMGSLDAWLAALGFAIFGQQVWVIRLVQGLLYLATLVTTGLLGKRAFGSWNAGALAMALLAIPTVNVSLYTTASLGGYGEALLLGNLILLVGLSIIQQEQSALSDSPPATGWLVWLAFGALCGLGLWSFGLALVYAAAPGVWLVIQTVKRLRQSGERRAWLIRWLALAAGGTLGASPWLIYAMQHGTGGLLSELGGSAIAGVERLPWILTVGQHLFGFLLLGTTVTLGLRPPWSAEWLALPLLPFVLILWLAVLGHLVRRLRLPGELRLSQNVVAGVMGVLVLAFVLSPFGADPSGRYFLPLAVPLALFAAQAFLDWAGLQPDAALGLPRRWWIVPVAAGLLIVFQLWGNLQSGLSVPPGLTTQFYTPSQVDMRAMGELMQFLRREGETRGYTNYWVAYPLAFLSHEELIFTPRLPYHLDFRHTERDNRYEPYNALVAAGDNPAYITTNHPELDERLRQTFQSLGVTWQEAQIGDFHVFYHLSQRVPIILTGFGVTTQP